MIKNFEYIFQPLMRKLIKLVTMMFSDLEAIPLYQVLNLGNNS